MCVLVLERIPSTHVGGWAYLAVRHGLSAGHASLSGSMQFGNLAACVKQRATDIARRRQLQDVPA